jgi:hypothetical protein
VSYEEFFEFCPGIKKNELQNVFHHFINFGKLSIQFVILTKKQHNLKVAVKNFDFHSLPDQGPIFSQSRDALISKKSQILYSFKKNYTQESGIFGMGCEVCVCVCDQTRTWKITGENGLP